MAGTRVVMAIQEVERSSIITGLLTIYLVLTGPITFRRRTPASRWADTGAMLLALAVGLASVRWA